MPAQITKIFQRLFFACNTSTDKLCCAGVFLLLSGTLSAAENLVPQKPQSIRLHISHEVGEGITLEANLVPLTVILQKIAQNIHIPIHYALLPEEPVTLTCISTTVSDLLECLLGSRIDRVYRYPPLSSEVNSLTSTAQPEEVWLLPTNTPIKPDVRENLPPPARDLASLELSTEEQAQFEATLRQASSINIDERTGALSNLGLIGHKDNPEIRQKLEAALIDKNTKIRAQAIASLIQREGENANIEVQHALKDKDVNVRMAVLSNVHNDTAILQQALADSDKTIRNLAASKLNDLTYRKNK